MKSAPRPFQLILTCEHAGNRIPREYAALFRGAAELLASHRGWDPGALMLTKLLSRELNAPFQHVMWSRLLVESNRSPTNRHIWSSFTSHLPTAVKRRILDVYWWPHRRTVEDTISSALGRGKTVVHLAIHSFTPVLNGVARNADVGLLYDPSRQREKTFCARWEQRLNRDYPEWRVRRNYPYRGTSDGLTTWLRRRFPAKNYLGVEIEINQALVETPRLTAISRAIADSLTAVLAAPR